MAPGAPYGRGVETRAVVGDAQPGALAVPGQRDVDLPRVGVTQRVVQGLLGHPQHRPLLGGGQRPYAVAGEGDLGGVGPVEHLHLRPQRRHEAVLVEGRGAQFHDGGAQLVGGLGGEEGDLLELVLGPVGVAVHQGRGRLGGQPQREELLGDRVVQLMGEPGPLPGDGELAAALVEAGVGQGDGGVLGQDGQQLLVLGGETAAALGLGASFVGEEYRAENFIAIGNGKTQEIRHFRMS